MRKANALPAIAGVSPGRGQSEPAILPGNSETRQSTNASFKVSFKSWMRVPFMALLKDSETTSLIEEVSRKSSFGSLCNLGLRLQIWSSGSD